MEKKYRLYAVVSYDPKWVERYEQEKEIISDIFKEKVLDIKHVGSTSVEGMWAKNLSDNKN